jgi:hypothetical protein
MPASATERPYEIPPQLKELTMIEPPESLTSAALPARIHVEREASSVDLTRKRRPRPVVIGVGRYRIMSAAELAVMSALLERLVLRSANDNEAVGLGGFSCQIDVAPADADEARQ